MNYLAHFLLALPRPLWVAGALAGDFVKGPLRGEFSVELEQGIMLHRRIDSFSDALPGLRAFRQGLDPEARPYSGAILDLVFDQQLAQRFSQFHSVSLETFSDQVNATLSAMAPHLDAGSLRFAEHMARNNLLCAYREDAVIALAATAIARRSRKPPLVHAAFEAVRERRLDVAMLFQSSFPDIVAHSASIKLEFDPGLQIIDGPLPHCAH